MGGEKVKKCNEIMNSGNFISKAPNQKKHKQSANVISGGDLRANKTGGQGAKK